MMIETPSAALLAEYFAEHVSFFSIGSNDLTQYTLAADRTSDQVAHIFDQLHPAVLRLVYHVSQVAYVHHLPLELCGDMATFLAATPLLIGLGIRTFSVAPSYVQPLKARIASTQCDHAQQLLTHALECRDVTCLYALLDRRTESPSQDTVV
ncbi:MAG: phosphoenolpyruvate--protein phosphotransferase, partial [Chlorobi bacterium]|nr:phosphoenolpyruvate--protein phosphotransferase [Chlorobiota bacterium]